MNNELLWNDVLTKIRSLVTEMTYNVWFKDTKLIELNDNTAKILVVIPIAKEALKMNYYEEIDNILCELTGKNYDLEFLIKDELLVDNYSSSIENTIVDNNINSNLIPRYRFDNFIVGDSNRFAYNSSLKVAEEPGIIYNPFFIYGKSGLGKTHLMHAIGNEIVDKLNKKVLYITSEDFISDFTGINNKSLDNNYDYVAFFKNKYRNVDVLIIDDIQFLAGAEKTQQEFFHTYNSLYNSGKQIIISSDRSPDDLNKLEDRLRTRFISGLTVNIFPPDLELKCNIIKNKIKDHEVSKNIDEDVIEFIANSCENDVRHLEGAITRLYAYIAMTSPDKINIEFANEALKDYITKSFVAGSDISKIQKAVADYFHSTVEDLKSKKRTKDIAYQRQIAMYLCRMLTDESFFRIGLEFGGKDHSTIVYACDKVESDLKNNNQLKEIIKVIKDKII